MRTRSQLLGGAAGLAASLALVACGSDSGPSGIMQPPIPPIPELTIEPADVALQVGQSVQLQVVGGGGLFYLWTSDGPDVAMVSSLGKVTAVGLGSANIRVSGAHGEGEALVVVR